MIQVKSNTFNSGPTCYMNLKTGRVTGPHALPQVMLQFTRSTFADNTRGNPIQHARLPDYPITRLPDYPITRLPNYPITRLPDYPITRLPDYPITRLPDYPLLRVLHQPVNRRLVLFLLLAQRLP